MHIASLICEYNPFHNGHKRMLDIMRERGVTHIVACMSGNFTQRGEPAVLDKFSRAKAALHGGVDLIIQLDTPHTIACAERFATGGVYLLNALGCIDTIFFGSECGNIDILQKTAKLSLSYEFNASIPKLLKSGVMTYAAAMERAAAELGESCAAEIMKEPNNILALEYIKALIKSGSSIQARTIERVAVGHNSYTSRDGIASASYIRHMILNRSKQYSDFLPKTSYAEIEMATESGDCPHEVSNTERILLYRLRCMNPDEIRLLPDVSEGLENRIKEACGLCSYTALLEHIKSKRYTQARLRRILLCALLGIKDSDTRKNFDCIRVLGLNRRGREILKKAQETSSLPIYTRFADRRKLPPDVRDSLEHEDIYDDIYALTAPKIQLSGSNRLRSAIYIDE